MKEIEFVETKHFYSSDDKLKWGYGEWVEEVDAMYFTYKNYDAHIIRNNLGALCGYIAIPKNHPWYKVENDYDIPCNVHGGITFDQLCIHKETNLEQRVIGFDCSHFNDLSPALNHDLNMLYNDHDASQNLKEFFSKYHLNDVYKNINYCVQECKSMIEQAIESEIADIAQR